VRRRRLPRPLVNRTIEGEEVDFLWPGQRLVVKGDVRATHLTRHAFERDRARDAKLTIAGSRVVRFTFRQIRHDARTVVATLRDLLAHERSISSIR
jgi:very-short-patch-repair endonuclease